MGDSSTNSAPGPSKLTYAAMVAAATMKKTYVSIKNPSLTPALDKILEDSVKRSFSTYAVIADFTGFSMDKGEIVYLIHSDEDWNVETIKFLKQGTVAEIGFLSANDLNRALQTGLAVGERGVPLTRCFSQDTSIVFLQIRDLPCNTKEATAKEITRRLQGFGVVKEVKFHYYGDTNICMDSCTAILDISEDPGKIQELRRQMLFFDAPCEVWWRDAPAFCRYCKKQGHAASGCPTLARNKRRAQTRPSGIVSDSATIAVVDTYKEYQTSPSLSLPSPAITSVQQNMVPTTGDTATLPPRPSTPATDTPLVLNHKRPLEERPSTGPQRPTTPTPSSRKTYPATPLGRLSKKPTLEVDVQDLVQDMSDTELSLADNANESGSDMDEDPMTKSNSASEEEVSEYIDGEPLSTPDAVHLLENNFNDDGDL